MSLLRLAGIVLLIICAVLAFLTSTDVSTLIGVLAAGLACVAASGLDYPVGR